MFSVSFSMKIIIPIIFSFWFLAIQFATLFASLFEPVVIKGSFISDTTQVSSPDDLEVFLNVQKRLDCPSKATLIWSQDTGLDLTIPASKKLKIPVTEQMETFGPITLQIPAGLRTGDLTLKIVGKMDCGGKELIDWFIDPLELRVLVEGTGL